MELLNKRPSTVSLRFYTNSHVRDIFIISVNFSELSFLVNADSKLIYYTLMELGIALRNLRVLKIEIKDTITNNFIRRLDFTTEIMVWNAETK